MPADYSLENLTFHLQEKFGMENIPDEAVREAGYQLYINWCNKHGHIPFSRKWADGFFADGDLVNNWEIVDLHQANLINAHKRSPRRQDR